MTVSAITHSVVSSMKPIKPATFALTALAVYVLSNIPTASAGSLTWAKCMQACDSLSPGYIKTACQAACLITIGPWLP